MRIVFMGTADFGVPTLRILNDRHEIAAVITRPGKPKGRGRKIMPSPVKVAAGELGIEVLEPERLSDPAFIAALEAYDADLFYVVAFRILPREVFTMPRSGTVNLHASLLPDYRGAAPVNWAVINGDTVTGLTTFFIDDNIDTGDILLQADTSIGPDETAGELYDRLKVMGADISLDTVDMIDRGEAVPRKQPPGKKRPAPKLCKENGRIDWTRDAASVHNHVRGMNPVPGAFTDRESGPLKIHRTSIADTSETAPPGTILHVSPREGFIVACGTGSLNVLEVQPPGKKPMDGASFVRGYGIEPGVPIGKKPGDGNER